MFLPKPPSAGSSRNVVRAIASQRPRNVTRSAWAVVRGGARQREGAGQTVVGAWVVLGLGIGTVHRPPEAMASGHHTPNGAT